MLEFIAASAIAATVGSFTPGSPANAPAAISFGETSSVSVRYVSKDASARGMLSFLGAEHSGVLTAPTARTPADNITPLGLDLFTNHNPARGVDAPVELGTFAGGSTLHFAFFITRGVWIIPDGETFRTDTDTDPAHFTVMSTTSTDEGSTIYRVGLEDIRDASRSDWDYNDLIFDVAVQTVPGPGPALLAGLGAVCAATRRRK